MTTTIPSIVTTKSLKVRAYPSLCVDFTIAEPERDDVFISVETSDLLAAVRTEFGVLIIDKADLPKVDEHFSYLVAGVTEAPKGLASADLREKGLAFLAFAEHLEAHPPVDEQQVEALVSLLNQVTGDGASSVARALLATGKVAVKS